jgi:PHD/YefM family antitoxin component YafN of YafNO toxin-antitoxin module
MQFDLEYSSRRREVMKLYWRSWRENLWKVHARAFLAVGGALLLILRLIGLPTATAVAVALVGGLVSIAWLPLFPLWKFKPQRRTLTVDDDGLRTTVGNQSGEVAWSDFASVTQDGENVVLTRKSGNAFVVPPRAFESAALREEFLAFVLRSVERAKADDETPRRPSL